MAFLVTGVFEPDLDLPQVVLVEATTGTASRVGFEQLWVVDDLSLEVVAEPYDADRARFEKYKGKLPRIWRLLWAARRAKGARPTFGSILGGRSYSEFKGNLKPDASRRLLEVLDLLFTFGPGRRKTDPAIPARTTARVRRLRVDDLLAFVEHRVPNPPLAGEGGVPERTPDDAGAAGTPVDRLASLVRTVAGADGLVEFNRRLGGWLLDELEMVDTFLGIERDGAFHFLSGTRSANDLADRHPEAFAEQVPLYHASVVEVGRVTAASESFTPDELARTVTVRTEWAEREIRDAIRSVIRTPAGTLVNVVGGLPEAVPHRAVREAFEGLLRVVPDLLDGALFRETLARSSLGLEEVRDGLDAGLVVDGRGTVAWTGEATADLLGPRLRDPAFLGWLARRARRLREAVARREHRVISRLARGLPYPPGGKDLRVGFRLLPRPDDRDDVLARVRRTRDHP